MTYRLKHNKQYKIETKAGTSWNRVFKGKEFLYLCACMETAYQTIYRETGGEFGALSREDFE